MNDCDDDIFESVAGKKFRKKTPISDKIIMDNYRLNYSLFLRTGVLSV